MTKTYPKSYLYPILKMYDPTMNRIDNRLPVAQQIRNERVIDKAIKNKYNEIITLRDILNSQLTDREQRILNQRNIESKKLRECGEEYGISSERIRQIESRAYKKLQSYLPFYVSLLWPENGEVSYIDWEKTFGSEWTNSLTDEQKKFIGADKV